MTTPRPKREKGPIMADENNIQPETAAAPAAGAEGRQFNLQRQYLRDASFELPNAPQIFNESGKPEFAVNLAQKVADLGENLYEVVITLTVTTTIDEKTVYLAEVHQGGIFLINGFSEQEHHALINTMCPHYLFPYARASATSLISDGGFPAPPIQPVNFEQVYAQRIAQAQQEQGAPAEAGGAPVA